MKRLLILVALVFGANSAFGQSVNRYLQERAKYHIVQPISSQDLDSLVGSKVVEIDGTVQGSFSSGPTTSLMVLRGDGQQQIVESQAPPQWLGNGEVSVRLLVKVSRGGPDDALAALLIDAAPESDIRKVDAQYWRRMASRRATTTRKRSNLASRSGGDRGMYGWIGSSRPATSWAAPDTSVTPVYAEFIRRRNPRLSAAKANEIARDVVGFSLHYGVDARLVVAILIVESDFDPNSTSRSGAAGLGQLMPDTARWMGVRDRYNTTDNLYGMVKLLRTHLDQYKAQTGEDLQAITLALAAYNAGEGAVRRHGGVPPYRETQAYVARVIALFRQLCGE